MECVCLAIELKSDIFIYAHTHRLNQRFSSFEHNIESRIYRQCLPLPASQLSDASHASSAQRFASADTINLFELHKVHLSSLVTVKLMLQNIIILMIIDMSSFCVSNLLSLGFY